MDGTGWREESPPEAGDRLIMALWQHYIYRKGTGVHDLWDSLFLGRKPRLLYISGRGFDLRAQAMMRAFTANVIDANRSFEKAHLTMVGFSGYQLSEELVAETEANAEQLIIEFQRISDTATTGTVVFGSNPSASDEDDEISPSNALRLGTSEVLKDVSGYTDIILDASSLPRVVYLSLLTSLLERLIPDKSAEDPLAARGINLQVVVAEDPQLDAKILAEDPSNDLIYIPGFSGVLHVESVQDWPLVWFPMLGEGRVAQLTKVANLTIPEFAEICPILPHPSLDPRRADRLMTEYRQEIFLARQTPTTNILYAHEAQPFEAYRQLLQAMKRYRNSMMALGGCRLVVTPLASKLITIGAALACFEMKPVGMDQGYGVAIPYAEPKRYIASPTDLRASTPEIAALVLTGDSYTR
jgi:hypothetical protein